jgi:hypothetical protein
MTRLMMKWTILMSTVVVVQGRRGGGERGGVAYANRPQRPNDRMLEMIPNVSVSPKQGTSRQEIKTETKSKRISANKKAKLDEPSLGTTTTKLTSCQTCSYDVPYVRILLC